LRALGGVATECRIACTGTRRTPQRLQIRAKDRAVPAGLDVHLVCDNYATHNTAEIRTWLARRPRSPANRAAIRRTGARSCTGGRRPRTDHAGAARCSAIELPPSTTRYCPVM
jgi:hypothetical protein